MAICRECEEEFSDKRFALGYDTCLECGGEIAKKKTEWRKKSVAPAYNKGNYVLITNKEDLKSIYKTADNYTTSEKV